MEELHSDDGKIRTVPDCVDPYFFRPQPRDRKWQKFRERLGIPADRRVVVYLGLLAEYQGTGILLQAARRVVDTLGNVHFLIMGYPAEEVYRAAATGLGLEKHVTFTGRIPYEQAPKCLAQGDIAVAPKLSATEGQGKLLNYMATGLPIVAFDVPVSREYLGDLGVYARPGDADALAEAICSLLSDENKMGELGQTLRERAKHNYSWEAAGKEIVDIYETCLAN
jgi:glycosyltransferase involved in cell wall biosynthesis